MIFGKVNRYCPNCGKHLYDSLMSNTHVGALICSDECRNSWETKYARFILGKDEENDQPNPRL